MSTPTIVAAQPNWYVVELVDADATPSLSFEAIIAWGIYCDEKGFSLMPLVVNENNRSGLWLIKQSDGRFVGHGFSSESPVAAIAHLLKLESRYEQRKAIMTLAKTNRTSQQT